jgi:hypothetical protein
MKIFNFKFTNIRNKKPYADSDRDGVMNWFDCAPNNPQKQEVLRWEEAKHKVISKKHLFHKTSLEAARKILKTGELRPSSGTGKAHLSENYNPHVVFKEYENPVVLVLEKKKVPYVKKIDYNRPDKYQDLKFKSEKEWVTPGAQIKKVLKGVILNEGKKLKRLPQNTPGIVRVTTFSYPTKYVTGEDIYKI